MKWSVCGEGKKMGNEKKMGIGLCGSWGGRRKKKKKMGRRNGSQRCVVLEVKRKKNKKIMKERI